MKAEPRLQRPRSTYIEYLEKRIAPATFVVTNLNDAGAGSLRFAVERANATPGADTIVFRGVATSGEIALTGGEIDITDSVNIQGPGAGKLIIDAQNLSRIFNIDDGSLLVVKKVTISGLSMVEGNSGTDFGGAILSRESLTLVNSVVSGSQGGDGGGIGMFTVGKLIIRNSKITGNTSSSNGGGIFALANGGIEISNSVVSGNTAAISSGGIEAEIDRFGTGNILIANSTITQNTSEDGDGGGIRASNLRSNGATTVRSTVISGNSAATDAGGLYLFGGRALIDRCVISNNIGTGYGGGLGVGLFKPGDSLTIKNSQIINNHTANATSPYAGGGGIAIRGINVDLLPVTIQGSLISDNSSDKDGGGILVLRSRFTLQNSTISGNSSGDDGGGIYAAEARVAITKSTLRDNSAADLGGGLAAAGPSERPLDLRITGSTFSANRAGYSGGAVQVSGYGSVAISSSKFLQNSAGGSGGGLHLVSAQGSISITGSTIGQNRALYSGGGVFVYGAPTVPVTIVTTTISNNMAGVSGGGVLFVNGLESFRATTITGNVAGIAGGGIANYSGAPLTLNGTIVTGNTAPTFPQISGPVL